MICLAGRQCVSSLLVAVLQAMSNHFLVATLQVMFQHFLMFPFHMTHKQSPAPVLQGLGEDITKPKSRLEREKEAAAAATAKPGSTSEVRKSSANVRSKVADAWQGQGLESVLHKRKSKLEQDKENAAAAAASTSPKETQKPGVAARSAVAVVVPSVWLLGIWANLLSWSLIRAMVYMVAKTSTKSAQGAFDILSKRACIGSDNSC